MVDAQMSEWVAPNENADDFTCAVCFLINFTPVMLFCKHSFCQQCVVKLVQNQTGEARCPLCRVAINKDLFDVCFLPVPELKLICKFCKKFSGNVTECKEHIINNECDHAEKNAEKRLRITVGRFTDIGAGKTAFVCGHEVQPGFAMCLPCDVRKFFLLQEKK